MAEAGRGPAGCAGPNPPTTNGVNEALLTPEVLFKMNKKIAQLTKVVYGLNTRGEELELQLSQAKEVEDELKEANAELSRRANLFRNKFDGDVTAGSEAHYYKMECENLKRRLEELSYAGSGVATAAVREELEQTRRREKSLQYELDQARHAISSMKSHHDFIMRERDSQLAMEHEKTQLEWQSRVAEVEGRYKSQVRVLTDELDGLRGDRDMQRMRAQSEDHSLRDKITALGFEKERDNREWQLKLQKKEHELDEQKIKHSQEKREKDQKIRQLIEEKRKENEQFQQKMRDSSATLEDHLRESQDRVERLTRQLQDKESEYETRLKSKLSELKCQRDVVEDNMQAEVLRLKGEIATLQSNSQAIDTDLKIQELKDELLQKSSDYELLSQNLKMRISLAETEVKNMGLECKNLEKHLKDEKEKNKQLTHRNNLQIDALERHLKEEAERHKFTQVKLEKLSSKVKGEIETKMKHLQESESKLKDENASFLNQVDEIKTEKETLERKLREKEREHQQSLEQGVKGAEAKVKSRLEKSWLEKLKKTEESASQDMTKLRDTHKRVEADLRKEISMLQKSEQDAKRLNEEFKKKVRQLRQSETELQQKLVLAESDSRDRSLSRSNSSVQAKEKQQDISLKNKKEMSSLEAKYQEQVDKLTAALAEKQKELSKSQAESEKLLKEREEKYLQEKDDLKKQFEEENEEKEKLKLKDDDHINEEDVETDLEESQRKYDKVQMELLLLKQQNEEFEEIVRDKHRKQMELELQVGEFTKEMKDKQSQLDSVTTELSYSKNECQLSKARISKLEAELDEFKAKVLTLETEIDNSERELKRMEILQGKLQTTEAKRVELQKQLEEVEKERDDEIKIIQDALDEAAQEREELLSFFEKEVEKLNALNAAREAQMLEEFEVKLKDLEKEHKEKLEEKERMARETSMYRGRRQDEEETRNKLDKLKGQLNSEWENKLKSECSRLKEDLLKLHSVEKTEAVESIRLKKEQELETLKQSYDSKTNAMNKEIAELKSSVTAKDSQYRQELEDVRTRADRDVWELRRKLQKLDDNSNDKLQAMEDKHRVELERLKEEYTDRLASMESQLASVDVRGMTELRASLEKKYNEQMEHMSQQHKQSMERLREELESEKVQAAEEARVIVSKHHEYLNNTLKEQLAEAITTNTQYREEIEAIKYALSRREEVIKSLEDEVANLKGKGGGSTATIAHSPQVSYDGSQGSRNSQESVEGDEDGHKGSGLLGKVFGGGWFSGGKGKDSPNGGGSGTLRRGSSTLHRQAW